PGASAPTTCPLSLRPNASLAEPERGSRIVTWPPDCSAAWSVAPLCAYPAIWPASSTALAAPSVGPTAAPCDEMPYPAIATPRSPAVSDEAVCAHRYSRGVPAFGVAGARAATVNAPCASGTIAAAMPSATDPAWTVQSTTSPGVKPVPVRTTCCRGFARVGDTVMAGPPV